ncbi:unnamed protein product [Lactuca saligna]|uniref:Uncharacterized protein n=1 Tax=Lactuca saligna TaxID=75948 RepID=A0AA36E2J5_LACSI|nr:unnamed protein product [Lactuca saligna]
MPIVIGVTGSNSQGAINEQTDMADPLADLAGILRHQARGLGHMSQIIQTDYRPQLQHMFYRPQSPQMGYTPQFQNTLPTPQTVLRPGGRDGFEQYYFEGADAQTTFRLPHTPHTPRPPNTPPTPHGSTSRGVTGGHDSNASDFQESSLPLIIRKGKKWNSLENSNIFEAFKCVLKDRYRDRMKRIRIKYGEMARNDGKPVPLGHCTYYEGMHDYRTGRVPENAWRCLCDNRKVADANGSTARHTAGSIGFDEHHNNLEKMMGKPPTQFDVFMKTHGTAEAKKRYFAGDHENLEYCSLTAKEAQEMYLQELVKKHGEDSSNHKDDARVWEEIQLRRKGKKKGDIYGI